MKSEYCRSTKVEMLRILIQHIFEQKVKTLDFGGTKMRIISEIIALIKPIQKISEIKTTILLIQHMLKDCKHEY